jgi:hypothetical protein
MAPRGLSAHVTLGLLAAIIGICFAGAIAAIAFALNDRF